VNTRCPCVSPLSDNQGCLRSALLTHHLGIPQLNRECARSERRGRLQRALSENDKRCDGKWRMVLI
jgi:hypothetical protein